MQPKIHCITNPVTMSDVANVLLAAGASAIMAQDVREVAEITAFCDATLLNTGVPSEEKFDACILAGQRANQLGHPVVLDPVGAGASGFRKEGLMRLLHKVRVDIIRCNAEEAMALLNIRQEVSGGVESSVRLAKEQQEEIAAALASLYQCTVLLSGEADTISDGTRMELVAGGDSRIARITGSGCTLSALAAMYAGSGCAPYEAAVKASRKWKECAAFAGKKTDDMQGAMGSYRMYLFDAVGRMTNENL